MEIVIPNLGDEDDEELPLPQFPGHTGGHGSQRSMDSNTSSPKRSASPLIRRLRGDSSASSRNQEENNAAFAFPQSASRPNFASVSSKTQGHQKPSAGNVGQGIKSPTRPLMKPRSGSSASESQYTDRYLPAASASTTSIHSIVMPAAQPTKKSSFANLKNAFKAAASAMERSSSSANLSSAGPSSTHGSSSGNQSSGPQPHPLAQQRGASKSTTPLPALKNPFLRSFSSSAVSLSLQSPHPSHSAGQNHHQPLTQGNSSMTRVTPSYNTSSKQSSSSSFLSTRKSRERDRVTAAKQSPGVSHIHKFSHMSRPSGHTVTTSSTSHSSGQFVFASAASETVPALPSSYATRRTPVTSPSAKTSMLAGMGGHSGSAASSMAFHQARIAAAVAAKAMPEPRSPNEIVMHELFRHFVAQSDSKVEQVVARPLMHSRPLECLHAGEDPLYDNLLRSLADCAKELPKQVIDFVAAWGQMQTEGVSDDLSMSQPSSSRYQEYTMLISERKTLAGRYIVYRLILEILQSDAGAVLPEDMTRELEESMFEAYAAEDSAYLARQDRKDVVAHGLAVLQQLSKKSPNSIVHRFISRLDGVMDGTYAEHVTALKVEHLLQGLFYVFQNSDKKCISDILSALGQRLSTASHVSWKATIAESITSWLEPRSLSINFLETEAWHDAITAITGQAERLVTEPGLWTAVFPLVVVCLCFAAPEEFNNLWRFRLEQAMGMLQSPQHKAYHEIALRNALRLIVVASLRESQSGQMVETNNFVQNLLFPTIANLNGFSTLVTNALQAVRPSELDLQLPSRAVPDVANQSSTMTIAHHMPKLPAHVPEPPAKMDTPPEYDKDCSPISPNGDDDIALSPIEFDEKDDTLGDLVGALHSLNEFFSAEDDDVEHKVLAEDAQYDLDYDQANEGRMRAILARSMRRGSSEPQLNWHLATNIRSPAHSARQLSGGEGSPGFDGLDIMDEQSPVNSIQQQISSWRLANQGHRTRPSMSSFGSITRESAGRITDSAFDLEDDVLVDNARDGPRTVAPMSAGSKKTGRLKNLVLASGSRFSPIPR
ncbi:hypothetical protein NliqN6_0813 [Naganishia liquefaciens]|uniref:Cell morphogenesis protein N-terminal domain-containing protein n=1 Tax=Naganishia liquefaciens TaxID=104408 RepID=A0A8H3TP94_9TREE|nr:hypothetical protein NliqN6_0813 [Naganishia liquefaciens]